MVVLDPSARYRPAGLKRGALALKGDVGSVIGAPKPGLDVAAIAEIASGLVAEHRLGDRARAVLGITRVRSRECETTAVSVG